MSTAVKALKSTELSQQLVAIVISKANKGRDTTNAVFPGEYEKLEEWDATKLYFDIL